jgi:hypothetical protein
MKTAGVILDFYDDLSGDLFKKAFPTVAEIPEVVKTAHILVPEERDVLRDEAYALVMHNEGKLIRKFACVDEGNTVLSVLYFMQNYDKLPTSVVKTAAENLSAFCEEYDLPVPSMLKLAAKAGMSRTRDSVRQPIVGDEADWAQRTNLVSVRGGSDSGRVIPAANQMKTAESRQGGAVLSTDKRDVGVKSKMPKLNNPDTKRINFLKGFHKLNPEANPKHKISVAVETDAPIVVKRASANNTALGGKYPLDSMADVQKAVEYFDENYKYMEPIEAHIYAVKTASRADELGLTISGTLQRYGSKTYAEDVDSHLANRIACTVEDGSHLYQELREKRASMEPEEFAEALTKVDEETGVKWYWGGDVADPYYATFGKVASSWSWQGRLGDFVSEDELKHLARNGRPLVHKHFSSEMVDQFIKDPIAIFESMPEDSKMILARLANGKNDGLPMN